MLMWQLAHARREAGVLQKDLAERSGYTREAVCMWEKGRRTPSLTQAEDMALALGYRIVLVPDHWSESEERAA